MTAVSSDIGTAVSNTAAMAESAGVGKSLELPENLTAQQLANTLGLPAADIKKHALNGKEDTGTALSSNPALSSIIKLLKMMFTLGIKVDKQSFELIKSKLEAANKSAEEAWQGAIAEFACNLTAGVVSAGIGAGAFRTSLANRNNSAYQPSMWLGPVGVQVITGPISSAGQFANAEGQLESQKMKNLSDEMGEFLQQMQQMAQSLRNPQF